MPCHTGCLARSYAWPCHVIRVAMSCHTRWCAMSYALMCHVIRVDLPCHTRWLAMSYALTYHVIRVDLWCHTRCIAMSYAFPCLNVRVALACHTQGLQHITWMLEYPIKILVIAGAACPGAGQCFRKVQMLLSTFLEIKKILGIPGNPKIMAYKYLNLQ